MWRSTIRRDYASLVRDPVARADAVMVNSEPTAGEVADKIDIDPSRRSEFVRKVLAMPYEEIDPIFVDPDRDYQTAGFHTTCVCHLPPSARYKRALVTSNSRCSDITLRSTDCSACTATITST